MSEDQQVAYKYLTTTHKIKLSPYARYLIAKYRFRRWWRLRRMTIEERDAYIACERAIDEGMTRALLYGDKGRD